MARGAYLKDCWYTEFGTLQGVALGRAPRDITSFAHQIALTGNLRCLTLPRKRHQLLEVGIPSGNGPPIR